jgi:hypothetical protein
MDRNRWARWAGISGHDGPKYPGLSQRAFAIKHGIPIRQVGYWVRRLRGAPTAPALLPVRVAPTMAAAPLSLRSEQGWTLTLPGDVPASWLAELMRAL